MENEHDFVGYSALEIELERFAKFLREKFTIPMNSNVAVTTETKGESFKGQFRRPVNCIHTVDGEKVPNIILNKRYLTDRENCYILMCDVLALYWNDLLQRKDRKDWTLTRPETWVGRMKKFGLIAHPTTTQGIYEVETTQEFKELLKEFKPNIPEFRVKVRYSAKPKKQAKKLTCSCGKCVIPYKKGLPLMCAECKSVLTVIKQ